MVVVVVETEVLSEIFPVAAVVMAWLTNVFDGLVVSGRSKMVDSVVEPSTCVLDDRVLIVDD